jgi:uncharacterized protein
MSIHPQVRVTVRPYGSVVPLGFFAFGIGMFLYAAYDAPWVNPTEGHTIGLMLVSFVAPLLAVVAWLGQPLIAALLTFSIVRAVCSAVYQLGGGAGWNHVGGWIALAIYCVAMYGGLTFLLEDAKGRAVLPLKRRGSSLEAIEGDMSVQLADLAQEPGVRKHL